MNIFIKKFSWKIAFLLVCSLVFISISPLFARPARAQWVVWDPGNFVPNSVTAVSTSFSAGTDAAKVTKEFGLDTVAWVIVNYIIERMAASTVTWINSGFQGKPAYVTDTEKYFTDIGDKIAGQYISTNPNLDFLCGPIKIKIRAALVNSQNRDGRRWQCTLTQVGKNLEDFMGDFGKGGWDSFFELTQKQHNNPLGAYLQAENELNIKIATRQETKAKELNWGRGFMSWETCDQRDTDGVCIGRADIATPGSVIENKLNDVLGIGNNKLAAADEINEIVSALLNQMISQVVGGIGRGLRGLSGGGSVSNQIVNSTSSQSITNYVNNPVGVPTINPVNPGSLTSGIPQKFFGISPTGQACDPSIDPSCTTQEP